MSSNIEKIRTAEAEIKVMEKIETDTRAEALRDGIIDEAEQADLDRIKGKIRKLVEIVAKLRADFELNRGAWNARAPDYATWNSQLAELADWEVIEHSVIASSKGTIASHVTAEDYAAANLEFETAVAAIQPLYKHLTEQKQSMATHDYNWPTVSERVSNAASCTYEFLRPQMDNVELYLKPVEEAVLKKDYIAAVDVSENLLTALDEFDKATEFLSAGRENYDVNLAANQDAIDTYSASNEDWGYLEAQLKTLAEKMAKSESEATFGDFETANTTLAEVIPLLGEIALLVAGKKAEYETAFAVFDGRLIAAQKVTYVDLGPKLDEIKTTAIQIKEAATKEAWVAATDLCATGLKALDAYDTEVKDQKNLITIIESRFPALVTQMEGFKTQASSVRKSATKRKASIEKALAGTASLTQAAKDIDVLLVEVDEMAEVKRVMGLLDAAAADDKDDVAKAIVTDLKSKGKLDTLPTELRSTLIESLMEGTPTADEHTAIQEIFKIRHVDREFEGIDAPVRKSIIESYMKDPKVKELSTKWETMTDAERTTAVKELIKVPCGDDGWKVGVPANIEPFDDPTTGGRTLYGGYSHGADKMTFNTHDDAHKDFGESLDTITHEIGHRRQRTMVDDLKAGTLTQGHPDYEQARWLKQYFDYKDKDRTEAKKVYLTSPSETHSRIMGNEMKDGLKGGFSIP